MWISFCYFERPVPCSIATVQDSTRVMNRGKYESVVENEIKHLVLEFKSVDLFLWTSVSSCI